MEAQLERTIHDPQRARELAQHGLATIRSRHTCAHRVDELLSIASGQVVDEPAKGARRSKITQPKKVEILEKRT